ncbi:17372_t:CDS:1, partial [Racocetra persica]
KEQSKKQVTLPTVKIVLESKKEVIEDLIKAFSFANILLEKVNSLLPFFKKYFKKGGAIPQASTLRQLYLPTVFEHYFTLLQSFFNQKLVAIIMDEMTDD